MEAKNYLSNDEKSKVNFKMLKEQFNKNFIPFLGTGQSIPLGECDWEKLFNQIKNSIDTSTDLAKDSEGFPNYPRSFSNLCRKMGDNRNFFAKIFQSIEPTVTKYTACHISVVKAFDCYVTTNYDTPIEEAYYEIKNQRIKRYFFSCYEMDNFKGSIVYLHGHKNINFAILKEEDYNYFYPTVSQKCGIPILENFLEEIYKSKTIVFLGFSFQDKYVSRFFGYLASKYQEVQHFLLTSTKPEFTDIKIIERFHSDFRNMKIYPIVYTEHIFVEQLLNELAIKIPSPIIDSPLITGKTP